MAESAAERFTVEDLEALSALVASAWREASALDWSVPAGTLEWSCLQTADHAVDCVYAPAFFLASRRTDAYPEAGEALTLGDRATPERLAASLELATRLLRAVVRDAGAHERAILFRRPAAVLGSPDDFPARAALELALHAHDIALGLGRPFRAPSSIVQHLRDHTVDWPVWATPPRASGDAWTDLLAASGRSTTRG